jgi:hypothetical protein
MRERLRILVCGMIAADPGQGGATWAVLQYVLGLRGLGHDVYLLEPIAADAVRPRGLPLSASRNAAYFRDIAARFHLQDCAALIREDTKETVGLPYDAMVTAARRADVLLNISGLLTDADLLAVIPCRVYLDLDPAFNQLWHTVDGIDMRFDGHTHFMTVGLAIGTAGCDVPLCGRPWRPFLQPVVLAEWPVTPPDPHSPWTTIANWRGYGSIEYRGVFFGQKAHSFRRFIGLPRQTGEKVQVALSIHPDEMKDLDTLHANGWELVAPERVAGTPDRYREFIQRSKGELGIAKSGYADARCGWFSDRSVCYLASGRPVIAQDTGFATRLPVGIGLRAFTSADEAAEAMDAVSADYERHCRGARAIAEEYFDANRVLPSLLAAVGM